MSDFLPQPYLTQLVQRTWGGLAPIQPVVSNRVVWGGGWTGADSLGASESPRFPEAPVLPDGPSSGLWGAADFSGSSPPPLASLFSEPSLFSEASSFEPVPSEPSLFSEASSFEAVSSEPLLFSEPSSLAPSLFSESSLFSEPSSFEPVSSEPSLFSEASSLAPSLFSEPSFLEAPKNEPVGADDEALPGTRSQLQPSWDTPDIVPSHPSIVQPSPVQPLSAPSSPPPLPPPTVVGPLTTAEPAPDSLATPVPGDASPPISPVPSPLLQRNALIVPAPSTEGHILPPAVPSDSASAMAAGQTPPQQAMPFTAKQTVPLRPISVPPKLATTDVKTPKNQGWGAELTNHPSPSNPPNPSAPSPTEPLGESNVVPLITTPFDPLPGTANPAASPDLSLPPPPRPSPIEPPTSLKSQPAHAQSAGGQGSPDPPPRRSHFQAVMAQPEAPSVQGALPGASVPMVSVVQRLFSPHAQGATMPPVHPSSGQLPLASQPAHGPAPLAKSPAMTPEVPLSDALSPQAISPENLPEKSSSYQKASSHHAAPLITHAIEPNISPVVQPADRLQGHPAQPIPQEFFQVQQESFASFSGNALDVPARGFSAPLSDQFPSQRTDPRPGKLLAEAPESSPIKITIGRIDVKVTTPGPASPPVRQKRQRPNVSLQDYLQQRGEK